MRSRFGAQSAQRCRPAAALLLILAIAACGPGPATSTGVPGSASGPGFAIRTAPDPKACPGAAVPNPLTFRIDPSAAEPVTAVAADGRSFVVYWAPGFVPDATSAAVVDPKGMIVARDGERLTGPLLHGHTVCATSTAVFVLLE